MFLSDMFQSWYKLWETNNEIKWCPKNVYKEIILKEQETQITFCLSYEVFAAYRFTRSGKSNFIFLHKSTDVEVKCIVQ